MATFEINRVMLLGNLTQDPETRYLQSGMAVSKMRLAANRRFRDKSGEQREETLFINVEAWGRTAELCQEYLRKGSEALVEGRLKMDTYQAQDGQNRTAYVVVADRVQFGRRPGPGGPSQGGSSEESYDQGGGYDYSAPPPASRPVPQTSSDSSGHASRGQQARGGGYGQQRPPQRQSQPPSWQAEAPRGGFPDDEAPPADDFGQDPGGTNNDLPF